MAIPAAAVWQVRVGGNENNGGGFVPGGSGIDRSRQDAAHAAGINLTVDAAVNTDVLPDGYTPSTADDNNVIQITDGASFIPGPYHIQSIQGGKWRLDRSPAPVGTSGGVWSLGGAVATPGKAGGLHVGGNLIWIDSGTYPTTSNTVNVSGGRVVLATPPAGMFTRIEGNPLDRPVYQYGLNINEYLVILTQHTSCRNIVFDGFDYSWKSPKALYLGNNRAEVDRCKFINFGLSFPVVSGNYTANITDCEFRNCNGTMNGFAGAIHHCYFRDCLHGNSACTFQPSAGAQTDLVECVFSNTPGYRFLRIYAGTTLRLLRCIFHNEIGGDGIWFQTPNNAILNIEGCIFENIGGYGIVGVPQSIIRLRNNAYYNCTSGLHNSLITEESGTIVGSESFFVDPDNEDFNINDRPGGGALLRSVTKVLAA